MTLMRCSARPSTREHTDRTSCGACVAAQIVSCSLDVPLGDKSARLQGDGRVRLLVDRVLDHVRRRGERRLDVVGLPTFHLADDVVGIALVHQLALLRGGRIVDDRCERLVVDDDELDRVLRDVAVVGDHERDRVADEAHLAFGEQRQRRRRAGRPLARVPELHDVGVDVGRDEHRAHAWQGSGLRGVDLHDASARHGAPHEAGVHHARPRDVVDERPPSGQQTSVLHPMDATAAYLALPAARSVTEALAGCHRSCHFGRAA